MNAGLRLSGVAAALGGGLRIYTALVPDPPFAISLWTLYLVIDALLLIGWVGIYAAQAGALGILGGINALTVALALVFLITRDVLHLEIYQLAAAILLVALALFSLLMLRHRIFQRWIPIVWLFAFAAGLGSRLLEDNALFAFALAGILFGFGFLGAGFTLIIGLERQDAAGKSS